MRERDRKAVKNDKNKIRRATKDPLFSKINEEDRWFNRHHIPSSNESGIILLKKTLENISKEKRNYFKAKPTQKETHLNDSFPTFSYHF